jgi:hypothetical protein
VDKKKVLQTQFSIRATDLAESFRSTVGRLRVGPHDYVPDMTAPEGPSTGGGVQAMQHLRLVPTQPGMPNLVVGNLNQRDGTAMLRTLPHMEAMCKARFGRGAPLDPAQYQAFLQSAQGFLAACGMRVSFEETPAALSSPSQGATATPSAPPKNNASLVVAAVTGLVVTLVVIAAATWLAFRR